jgi:hypothetical protein
MVEKGVPWERPAAGPADWEVDGDDAALAAAVRDHPGARVAFRPHPASDLARAIGIHAAGGPGAATFDLALDALRVVADGREHFAVNMVVIGTAPDRTGWFTPSSSLSWTVDERPAHDGRVTGIVVGSGQHLRGLDVIPRGHPGDGRAELQAYAVRRSQRSGMRSRLVQGAHLPHPDITQVTARRVQVRARRGPVALEIDGVGAPSASRVTIEVVPAAFVLVV